MNPLTVTELVKEAHQTALEKGWWDKPRTVGDVIALIHSELSEALECYRRGGTEAIVNVTLGENNKPEGFFVELADAIIRIADLAGRYNVDLEEILRMKLEYNKNRPYRHGNKQL